MKPSPLLGMALALGVLSLKSKPKKEVPMNPIDGRVVDVNSEAVAKASGLAPVPTPETPKTEVEQLLSRRRLRMARFRKRTMKPKYLPEDHNNMQANRVAEKKKAKAKKKKTEAMKKRQRAVR